MPVLFSLPFPFSFKSKEAMGACRFEGCKPDLEEEIMEHVVSRSVLDWKSETEEEVIIRSTSSIQHWTSEVEELREDPFESAVSSRSSQRQHHVLCYGDSLTAGFCAKGREFTPYGQTLRKGLQAAGVNTALSITGQVGHTASQMVAELDAPQTLDLCGRPGQGLRSQLLTTLPDMVIIMAGTNDIGKKRDVECIFRDLRQLHSVCHKRGIPTIVVAPPAPNTAAQQKLASLLESWAEDEELVLDYLDAEHLVPRSDAGLWDADRLHFSSTGSQQLGRSLCQTLLSLPEISGSVSQAASVVPMSTTAGNEFCRVWRPIPNCFSY